jgi:hypothetical protein
MIEKFEDLKFEDLKFQILKFQIPKRKRFQTNWSYGVFWNLEFAFLEFAFWNFF